MITFPIRVGRASYRGSKAALREKAAAYNRDAAMLERYVNDRIHASPAPIQLFTYGAIAPAVGLSVARVSEILFSVDCGHTGLTVAKTDEAWRRWLEERRL